MPGIPPALVPFVFWALVVGTLIIAGWQDHVRRRTDTATSGCA